MLDEPSLYFGWADYLIFTLTLVLSLLIGVYHAWRGAASSTSEYLLGGKSMGIFPIAMSFAARSVKFIIITLSSIWSNEYFFPYLCGGKVRFLLTPCWEYRRTFTSLEPWCYGGLWLWLSGFLLPPMFTCRSFKTLEFFPITRLIILYHFVDPWFD